MTSESKQKSLPKFAMFFMCGAAGVTATLICHPIDVVKNRMQLSAVGLRKKQYRSTLHVIRDIMIHEGIRELYRGISAGVLRQATYTTARLGIYQYLIESFQDEHSRIGFPLRALCGMVAGIAASMFGTPSEVSMVRMTADGRLPSGRRFNDRHVFDSWVRITKEGGVTAMWTGFVPNMGRAMIVNAVQLATYSELKSRILKTGLVNDNVFCHLWASLAAGFMSSLASSPLDIAKTRIQNMKILCGEPEYRGTVDALVKIVRKEGVLALWKGFTPYFARSAHTVLMFIFLEQYMRLYRLHWLQDTSGLGFL